MANKAKASWRRRQRRIRSSPVNGTRLLSYRITAVPDLSAVAPTTRSNERLPVINEAASATKVGQKPKAGKPTKHSEAKNNNEDEDEEDEEDLESSGSEFAVKLGLDEDEDEDEEEEDEDEDEGDLEDEDEEGSRSATITTKSKDKKTNGRAQMTTTSRALQAELERPRFKTNNFPTGKGSTTTRKEGAVTTNTAGNVSEPQANDQEAAALSEQPPDADITALVLNAKGQLNLSSQQQSVTRVMNRFHEECIADAAFNCGIYPVSLRVPSQLDLLIGAATIEDVPEIAAKVMADRDYAAKIIASGEQRVVLICGNLKGLCKSSVPKEYGLTSDKPGDQTRPCFHRVGALVHDLGYIFPGDIMGRVDGSAPFKRPIFAEIIKETLFSPRRGKPSLVVAHSVRFVSSSTEKPLEKEIPVPMLALASAAIRLTLDDWAGGIEPAEASKYTAAKAEEEYNNVIEFFDDLRKNRPRFYHRILHQVYVDVCSSGLAATPASQRSKQAVRGALARLVFDD
ncbi:uncharacterized protein PHACADRAFT_197505 [Phanerochaete carnosa HHB-10118-sp]|uniref:DUF6532 domain-containing protein n=1 Tax=Phanerochaete carnosa (strain HHB-10118-sp) TaxID=650164 RepID=K5WRQ8_PHACS|nr:uncharacterized protein PHACADRAFT_197505 [Phanerochaete carnosa HHB-10118-sp]EKM53072.1 hypothetical protein PHACADRAFT_197505 [Phanerochaete carnosa HHB-10118-sp]